MTGSPGTQSAGVAISSASAARRGDDQAPELLEVATGAQRVVDDRADDAGRVDHEHCADGLGGVPPGMIIPYFRAAIPTSSISGNVTSTSAMPRKVMRP